MPEPLLQARGIVKHYGHVEALRGCDFDVYPMRSSRSSATTAPARAHSSRSLPDPSKRDEGAVFLEGKQIHVGSPFEAMRLASRRSTRTWPSRPTLDGSANLYLGREIMQPGLLGKLGFLDNGTMRAGARKAFGELGVDLKNAQSAVANLSGGQRQSVAVARSVRLGEQGRLPRRTHGALGVIQTARVLETVKRIRDRGVAAVLISHNMRQVLEIADRIEVLRLGRRVARFAAKDATIELLVSAMTSGIAEEGAA